MDICVMGFYNIWQLDIANRRGDPGNPQVRGGGRNRPVLCGRQLRRCIDRQRPACDAGTGESSARDRPRIAYRRHLDRTELCRASDRNGKPDLVGVLRLAGVSFEHQLTSQE